MCCAPPPPPPPHSTTTYVHFQVHSWVPCQVHDYCSHDYCSHEQQTLIAHNAQPDAAPPATTCLVCAVVRWRVCGQVCGMGSHGFTWVASTMPLWVSTYGSLHNALQHDTIHIRYIHTTPDTHNPTHSQHHTLIQHHLHVSYVIMISLHDHV